MDSFNLPISYLENKISTNTHLITDLELVEPETQEDTKTDDIKNDEDKISLYEKVLNANTTYSKKTIPLWAKYFTSNKQYILDTQKLLKSNVPEAIADTSEMEDIWNDIILESDFYTKYKYLDNNWGFAKMLNNNNSFLQLLSIYNISSPLISLAVPILFLILPFFIIKIQGFQITIDKYIHVLKIVFKRHALGKLFEINTANFSQKVYILVSITFYVFQTYQNIISCKTFYKHTKLINNHLRCTKTFIKDTLTSMSIFEETCCDLDTYTQFIQNMQLHKNILTSFMVRLNSENFDSKNIFKCFSMGNYMYCFNKLYNDKNLNDSLEYSLYLNGYFSNLKVIQDKINTKQMSFCKLSSKHTSFKDAYFPPYTRNTVKNTYSLKDNMLITGPNAAGKTTILKTTLFNILISQQLGCGFYSSSKINPYDKIYSYLNIPDTSGRDSLFQAEARRCVNILNSIDNDKNNKAIKYKPRHFCVFDEIYSGTNPYEAIGAAISYLKHLNKYNNITFIVTTHFLDVCKHLEAIKKIKNYNMKILEKDNVFNYTYKIQKGISTVKGGVKVLRDLKYPKSIIDETVEIIKTLNI